MVPMKPRRNIKRPMDGITATAPEECRQRFCERNLPHLSVAATHPYALTNGMELETTRADLSHMHKLTRLGRLGPVAALRVMDPSVRLKALTICRVGTYDVFRVQYTSGL